jgi:nitrite reductase/ring-hydroxylating ferredoxin subunit
MLKKIGIVAIFILVIISLIGCAGPSSPSLPSSETTSLPNPTPAASSSDPAPNPEPELTLNPGPKPPEPIKATWITVAVDTDNQTVSIPISELEDNWDVHFKLETTQGDMNFMAYIFEGTAYVRANVCPPCRSVGFSLDESDGTLICDRCATVFNAETGAGVNGACVEYPKAAAPYEVSGGNLIIKGSDLMAAYEETLLPG